MRRIGAARFKEQCLALLDSLDSEGLVITKHGKPVAKLIPIDTEFESVIGAFRDKIKVTGDILSTGLEWDAQP
ncbi:MAG: type II toxin-antitoxin system Phd/YefM family antitoxin [Actinomycetota bacterium]